MKKNYYGDVEVTQTMRLRLNLYSDVAITSKSFKQELLKALNDETSKIEIDDITDSETFSTLSIESIDLEVLPDPPRGES